MNKEFIINNIARINADDLYAAIDQGVVTFEELKATGKFIYEKQEKVRAMLQVKDRIRVDDEQAWMQAKATDTIEAYRAYLQQYPNGAFTDNANNKILLKEQSGDDERRELLEDIRRNPENYSKGRIEDLLGIFTPRGRKLTKADLINANIITKEGLELFLNPPAFLDEQHGWGDLAPLKHDRTDIYFFGIPSSGKSCLLAGVLHYLFKNGWLKLDTNNMIGRKYADALLSLIGSNNIGYVPPSTAAEGVNYIEAGLRRGEGADRVMHPVNILEMSGELFIATYKNATTASSTSEGKKTIGANSYLYNDNRKAIFLIIDYQETISPLLTQAMANQALQLGTILDFLDKDGTLSKTDALHIVLTKTDLLPGGANDLAAAEAFIEREYKNLRQAIKDYRDQYGFRDCRIIPFSLGKFMLGKVFEYDPTYSEMIYKAITASTFVKPQSKRFKLW